ncbi:motile sperm domain-containing protein 2-like isoform X3 [Biomphalaria glabrata]|uniref:Motile sperm domain-containing protein 2-like isoform X3 n=1 Tax=Biomphalaria glabrata TaxID=6526 RepID=A0A9W3B4U1_BIOGL|nr:motile sperm domain-containing protein 2-like isoform X3 [Biomphalaria glabrata]
MPRKYNQPFQQQIVIMGVNENILYIRENFSKKYAENIAKGDYDARDLQRLQNDTEFACTYIRGDHRLDEGVDLLHSSFKFRNEMKINDLTEADFGKDVIDLGGLYFHKKDKQGHRILWLKVKVHKKDASAEFLTVEKKGIAFVVEKAFYNNPFSQVVVLLDMTNCGLVNMDIDFVQYIISLFKFYYPTFLAYILIYDMPWIFNAAWRVIKSWLNAEAVAKIKFVTKSDIQNYISPEDLPPYMGGTDTFQFVYVPGMSDHSPYPEDKTYKKQVHFLEAQEDTRSIDLSLTKVESEPDLSLDHNYNKPVLRHRSAGNRNNNSSDVRPMFHMQGFPTPGVLFISPAEELVFQVGDGGDSFDMISLTNSLPVPVAFKVKTTAPEKFRVRPSAGIIKPDKKEEVYVYLVPDFNADVAKDKFLVMAMETTVTNVADPNALFKDAPRDKIMQHKMRCTTVSSRDKRVTSPDENLASKEKLRSMISSPSMGKKFMSNTGSPAVRDTYQSQPSRTGQKKADGGEDLDRQVEQLEKQTKSLQMQLRLLMCVQFVTAVALILVMLAYSCYGEELFSRFLALPFDFCNDPYGRKC